MAELIEVYRVGRKPLKHPNGQTYGIGEECPDATTFANLAVLLRRGRLVPAMRSANQATAPQPEPPATVPKPKTATKKAKKKTASRRGSASRS